MQMTFGDWELFKVLILSLRELQLLNVEEEVKNTKLVQNSHPQSGTSHERKGYI